MTSELLVPLLAIVILLNVGVITYAIGSRRARVAEPSQARQPVRTSTLAPGRPVAATEATDAWLATSWPLRAGAARSSGIAFSPAMVACGHCGLALSPRASFCRRCGTRQG
jgi:hypothetical protein